MSIEMLILNFRGFLISSWSNIDSIMSIVDWDDDVYHLDDWMQANWELLVERNLPSVEALTSYGTCYPDSRYSDMKVASHRVVCRLKERQSFEKYVFRGFEAVGKDSHVIAPPFDMVSVLKIESKEIHVFSINDVVFDFERIE